MTAFSAHRHPVAGNDRGPLAQVNAPLYREQVATLIRAGSDDVQTFMQTLAATLMRAVPGQTRLTHQRAGRGAIYGYVIRLSVMLGGCHYRLSIEASGQLVASCALVCGTTIAATADLSVDAWLDLLAHDLVAYAQSSPVGRRALVGLAA